MTYIEYDNKPDVFDKRRLSRKRYALYSIPALAAAILISCAIRGLMSLMGDGSGLSKALYAMVMCAWLNYVLVRYQYRQLKRRCNDAHTGWQVADKAYPFAAAAAVVSGIFPLLSKPLILAIVLMFVYGMFLPYNNLSNIHGAFREDTPDLYKGQLFACFLLIILIGLLIY